MKREHAMTTRIIISESDLEELDSGDRVLRGAPTEKVMIAGADIIVSSELNDLFESMYDSAFITDARGTILTANPRAEKLLGYDSMELPGMSVLDLIEKATDKLMAAIRENISDSFVVVENGHCKRNSGELFPVEIAVGPLGLRHGECFCFFIRDLTHRRQAERRQAMLESLGAACHHLSQPATVLTTMLEVALRRAGDDEEMKDLLEPCVEAADELSKVLHRLNAVDEYRSVSYLEGDDRFSKTKIIEI